MRQFSILDLYSIWPCSESYFVDVDKWKLSQCYRRQKKNILYENILEKYMDIFGCYFTSFFWQTAHTLSPTFAERVTIFADTSANRRFLCLPLVGKERMQIVLCFHAKRYCVSGSYYAVYTVDDKVNCLWCHLLLCIFFIYITNFLYIIL